MDISDKIYNLMATKGLGDKSKHFFTIVMPFLIIFVNFRVFMFWSSWVVAKQSQDQQCCTLGVEQCVHPVYLKI